MAGLTRPGLLIALLAAVAGCTPDSHEAVLDDYLARLARVTRSPVEVAAPEPGPRLPERRALQVEIPRRTVEIAQFFELHGCDMGELVGLRNSPLGRVQGASQRLGYEAAWLAAVERCGAEAAEWLTDLGAEKREMLPRLFWNATFGGDEMHTALGSGQPPDGGDLADVLRGLNDSLTELLAGEFDLGAFEQRLAQLRHGSWVGPARRDWSRWRRYLGAAARGLDDAVPGICLNRRPTPRSRRLGNVFVKYYVEDIQPELAGRMVAQEAWITELDRLYRRLRSVAPPAFQNWFEAVVSPLAAHSEWRRAQAAVVDHAEAWQALFAHCGVEPGPALRHD